MNTSESFEALHRANPRSQASFAKAVDAATAEVRLRVATAGATDEPRVRHVRPGQLLVGFSAVGVALSAVAAVFVAIGSSGGTLGVENASAAITKAVTLITGVGSRSGRSRASIPAAARPQPSS